MTDPTTNSEGLAAFALTEEQKYLFDTRGWLLMPGVLAEPEAAEMRDFCYRLKRDAASLAPQSDRRWAGRWSV